MYTPHMEAKPKRERILRGPPRCVTRCVNSSWVHDSKRQHRISFAKGCKWERIPLRITYSFTPQP